MNYQVAEVLSKPIRPAYQVLSANVTETTEPARGTWQLSFTVSSITPFRQALPARGTEKGEWKRQPPTQNRC